MFRELMTLFILLSAAIAPLAWLFLFWKTVGGRTVYVPLMEWGVVTRKKLWFLFIVYNGFGALVLYGVPYLVFLFRR